MKQDIYFKIFGTLEKKTAKAYLWKLPNDQKAFWMPISQTRKLSFIPDEAGHYSIEVKEWILDDKAVPPSQRYDLEHPGPSADHPKPVQKIWDDIDDDCPF